MDDQDVEFYHLIRRRIEHEDGRTGPMADRQALLCRLIPLIGVATTALIYVGLIASGRALVWLALLVIGGGS
jgi:hypothetical protein